MEFLNTKPNYLLLLLRLVRWPNLLILLCMQWLAGIFLTYSESIFYTPLIWLSLSTVLVAAAGNVINDVYDVNIDAVNKPQKQIVEKFISRKNALLLYAILSFAGLLCAIFVNFQVFVITLVIFQLLWFYAVSLKCKPLIGNILVAALMAMSVYILHYIPLKINEDFLLFYAVFAFLTGWVREMVKDIQDIEGDKLCGCGTLAVKAGKSSTKITAAIISFAGIIFLLITAAGFLYLYYEVIIALYLAIAVALPWLIFTIRLLKAKTTQQFSRLSLFIKLIMLAGILSMPLIYFD